MAPIGRPYSQTQLQPKTSKQVKKKHEKQSKLSIK